MSSIGVWPMVVVCRDLSYSCRVASPSARRRCHGFTLIETMLAVLLLALLTAAAALSLSQPLKFARTADAVELLRSFDLLGRQAAVASGRNVRLVFDLSAGTLSRRDGADLQDRRSRVSLPVGCQIDRVKIGDQTSSAGEALVDVSPHGWSRSYTLHLQCPGADCWLCFAGLTGQMSQVKNESQIPTFDSSPRHDAD